MVQIEAAYYGDEKSFTNVTNSILSKVTNGAIDTVVSSALKPQFETTTAAKLTSKDDEEVTKRAIAVCGTAADTACMKGARMRMQQEMLREKERESTSGANMIKGNRLTVDVRDEKGNRKQIVVPENQKFALKGILADVPGDSMFPTGDVFYKRLWEYVGTLIGMFVYVLGILVPYAIFMREAERSVGTAVRDASPKKDYESYTAYATRIAGPGAVYKGAAYGSAIVSMIVPYSGLIIALLYYGGQSFVNEYTR